MACTTTTTFAPCKCYDIKYMMAAGSFTLVSVNCSGETIQTYITDSSTVETYYTLCSQCTPYTAFTDNAQTNDYVRISPRNLFCIDSEPCPTTTTSTTAPVVTSQSIKITITTCTFSLLPNTNPPLYNACTRSCSCNLVSGVNPCSCVIGPSCSGLIGGGGVGFSRTCCCGCPYSQQRDAWLCSPGPVHPVTNPPYLNPNCLGLPIQTGWIYNGYIYLGSTQICQIGKQYDGCPCGDEGPCGCI